MFLHTCTLLPDTESHIRFLLPCDLSLGMLSSHTGITQFEGPLVIQPVPTGRHLACFQFFHTINNSQINIFIHRSLRTPMVEEILHSIITSQMVYTLF